MPRPYASTVVNAPVDEVWALLRDFNGLTEWHPAVVKSTIEDGKSAAEVGCIRDLGLPDGGQIRERLLAFSDRERFYSYNFETTPFDVQNYCGTLKVSPVTDGNRTFIEWWTTFDCEPDKLDEWVRMFAHDIFKPGLDSLKKKFGG